MIILATLLSLTLQRVHVQFLPDEAQSVLAILDTRAAHRAVDDAQWQRLFASEGFVRLKKRELSMKRPLDAAAFREFVLSDALLAKREMLARPVPAWTSAVRSPPAAPPLPSLPPTPPHSP